VEILDDRCRQGWKTKEKSLGKRELKMLQWVIPLVAGKRRTRINREGRKGRRIKGRKGREEHVKRRTARIKRIKGVERTKA